MRVACPSCSAAYELPAALADRLGEGRPLRCARCGHTWTPGAMPEPLSTTISGPEPGPQPEPEPEPEPAQAGPLPAPPQLAPPPSSTSPGAGSLPGWPPLPPGFPSSFPTGFPEHFPDHLPGRFAGPDGPRPAVLATAWAASFLLLAAAAWAVLSWRVEIVAAWPPAARAFIALGLGG